MKSCSCKLFFLTSSIRLIVGRALAVVYNLYLNYQSMKLISILLKIRKGIRRITSILMSLANSKVSLKNQNFPFLLLTKKEEINILKVSNLLPSIFCIPTSIFRAQRQSFFAKLGSITLVLLLDKMRASIKCWLN